MKKLQIDWADQKFINLLELLSSAYDKTPEELRAEKQEKE